MTLTATEWAFILFWFAVSSAVVLAVPWLLLKMPDTK